MKDFCQICKKETVNKKFVFTIEVEAPTNQNPDYPENALASEIVFEMVKDAIVYCLKAKMDHLVKTQKSPEDMNENDKSFWDYLENKAKQYREIEKTIRGFQKIDEMLP